MDKIESVSKLNHNVCVREREREKAEIKSSYLKLVRDDSLVKTNGKPSHVEVMLYLSAIPRFALV